VYQSYEFNWIIKIYIERNCNRKLFNWKRNS